MAKSQPTGFMKNEWILPENIRKKIQKNITSGERVVVRVPGRIDLAGGWNDTPPYYFDNESAVLNTSVSFGNQWMVEVEIQKADYFGFIENDHLQPPPVDHIVIIKILEYLGLFMPPILIQIKNSIPKGSGLGGSSLLASAILSAIIAYALGAEYVISNPGQIVNAILAIEQMIGSGGGWQDQTGGMIPGIKLIQTKPNNYSKYHISYLHDLVADRLSSHSLVLNTGIRRQAVHILEPIRELYINKNKNALAMLSSIRSLSLESFDYLNDGNIHKFAETITKAWNEVIAVETRSKIPLIDEIMKICGTSLIGHKIAGAGGGGFAILIFASEDDRNYNELILQDKIPHGILYRPVFGRYGMAIHQAGNSFRMSRRELI